MQELMFLTDFISRFAEKADLFFYIGDTSRQSRKNKSVLHRKNNVGYYFLLCQDDRGKFVYVLNYLRENKLLFIPFFDDLRENCFILRI